MSKIKFNKQETDEIVLKIQTYFEKEMDNEIGQFEAEFLLDFFSEKIGPYYYNQGLTDAKTVIDERVESIADALYEIEKPIE
jgi:uncharacterized protein (DUF2164 family)